MDKSIFVVRKEIVVKGSSCGTMSPLAVVNILPQTRLSRSMQSRKARPSSISRELWAYIKRIDRLQRVDRVNWSTPASAQWIFSRAKKTELHDCGHCRIHPVDPKQPPNNISMMAHISAIAEVLWFGKHCPQCATQQTKVSTEPGAIHTSLSLSASNDVNSRAYTQQCSLYSRAGLALPKEGAMNFPFE